MTDQPLNDTVLTNVDKDTLLDLADQSHEQSISIFIPTHERGKEVNEGQDLILFKNHVQRMRQALEAQDLRSNEVNDLLQPLEALLEDTQFWRHQRQGLAVFRNPNYFAVFQSPLPLEESSQLGSRFRIRPLLPFAQHRPAYYLMQITKKDVSLYKVDAFSITPVDTAGSMPSGLEEVTKYYDFEEQEQGYTKGRSGRMAKYDTSQEADNKQKDHLLADYFRLVDQAIIDLMGTQNLPLVLASVEYYQPIYREINTYPHLHAEGLTGNFEHTQLDELHQMAQQMLGDSLQKHRQQRIEQYQNSSGGDLVSTNIRELLKAGVMGRIETLFMKADAETLGSFDENTLKATIHNEPRETDESLPDKVALLTLRHGGEVYVMDEVDLLNNQEPVDLAALFRF